MKKTLIALAIAATAVATPAFAKDAFTGPRAELTAGYTNGGTSVTTSKFDYGANVGYDFTLVGPVRLGATAGVDNFADRRAFNAGARLGLALNDHALVYATAGWNNVRTPTVNNFRNVDGLRYGAGVQLNVVGPFYTGLEYRVTDLGAPKKHEVVAAVGVRF